MRTAAKPLSEAQTVRDRSYIAALVTKWKPMLDQPGARPMNEHTRNCMAILYENQAQYLMGLDEETKSTNVGAFTKFVFPVLRRVFPSLIANDIVSVQPMTAPIGGIFYYELKYGTTKGKVVAGQKLVKDFNAYYSSEHIDEEVIGTGGGTSFTSTLDFTPVKAGTVKVVAGAVSGADTGTGGITGTGIVSGAIDYNTGAISVTFTSAVSASVNVIATYDYNMECNSNIPQINIDIELLEIKAKTRKLKALWCSEAADDLKAFHGLDAEAELVAGIASEIALELDREIIEDLRLGGTTTGASYAIGPTPSGVTELDHIRGLITKLTLVSNRIHKASLRGPANFLVTSPEVSAYIEQLTTHGDFRPVMAAPDQTQIAPVQQPHTFGVYMAGTVSSKYVLYKDPYFPTVNVGSGSGTGEILVGYKGQNFLDAGYVWAPYVPLQLTATFLDPDDFKYRKGLRTRYATKMVRPEFYSKVTVTGM